MRHDQARLQRCLQTSWPLAGSRPVRSRCSPRPGSRGVASAPAARVRSARHRSMASDRSSSAASSSTTPGSGHRRRRCAVARDGNELRLGMMVDVDGTTIAAGPNGPASTAASVRLTRAVVGPVTASDVGRRTLSVLGQTVVVNGSTAFDATLHGGLAALKAGDMVSVYGLAGSSRADGGDTRRTSARGDAWRLEGCRHGTRRQRQALRHRRGHCSTTAAPPTYRPALPMDNGFTSRSAALRSAACWPWRRSARRQPRLQTPHMPRSRAWWRNLTGKGQLRIGAISVDASLATIDPAPAALVAGAHAEVSGRLAAGVLVADKVRLLTPQEAESRSFHVIGTVGGLSATNFLVRGVAVDASAATYVNGAATITGQWRQGARAGHAFQRRHCRAGRTDHVSLTRPGAGTLDHSAGKAWLSLASATAVAGRVGDAVVAL